MESIFGIQFRCLLLFPNSWPTPPLASPASAMSISLSTRGFSIVHPIWLLPSWVAIVAGFHDITSSRSVARVQPSLLIQGGWKCRSMVSLMLDVKCSCLYVALCRGCWVVWKFLLLNFAQTFRASTQLHGFRCELFFADAPTLLRRSKYVGSYIPESVRR